MSSSAHIAGYALPKPCRHTVNRIGVKGSGSVRIDQHGDCGARKATRSGTDLDTWLRRHARMQQLHRRCRHDGCRQVVGHRDLGQRGEAPGFPLAPIRSGGDYPRTEPDRSDGKNRNHRPNHRRRHLHSDLGLPGMPWWLYPPSTAHNGTYGRLTPRVSAIPNAGYGRVVSMSARGRVEEGAASEGRPPLSR